MRKIRHRKEEPQEVISLVHINREYVEPAIGVMARPAMKLDAHDALGRLLDLGICWSAFSRNPAFRGIHEVRAAAGDTAMIRLAPMRYRIMNSKFRNDALGCHFIQMNRQPADLAEQGAAETAKLPASRNSGLLPRGDPARPDGSGSARLAAAAHGGDVAPAGCSWCVWIG